jgi:hypothetical protein
VQTFWEIVGKFSSLFMFVFAYFVSRKLVAVIRIPCSSKLLQLDFLSGVVKRENIEGVGCVINRHDFAYK